mmetsp:Transcript_37497/g.99931  ORF Transcript_37497/g.99931 Transcript_37497/m.99931 type:complete len:329 (+) Transcript_37497:769-1755(+)
MLSVDVGVAPDEPFRARLLLQAPLDVVGHGLDAVPVQRLQGARQDVPDAVAAKPLQLLGLLPLNPRLVLRLVRLLPPPPVAARPGSGTGPPPVPEGVHGHGSAVGSWRRVSVRATGRRKSMRTGLRVAPWVWRVSVGWPRAPWPRWRVMPPSGVAWVATSWRGPLRRTTGGCPPRRLLRRHMPRLLNLRREASAGRPDVGAAGSSGGSGLSPRRPAAVLRAASGLAVLAGRAEEVRRPVRAIQLRDRLVFPPLCQPHQQTVTSHCEVPLLIPTAHLRPIKGTELGALRVQVVPCLRHLQRSDEAADNTQLPEGPWTDVSTRAALSRTN